MPPVCPDLMLGHVPGFTHAHRLCWTKVELRQGEQTEDGIWVSLLEFRFGCNYHWKIFPKGHACEEAPVTACSHNLWFILGIIL